MRTRRLSRYQGCRKFRRTEMKKLLPFLLLALCPAAWSVQPAAKCGSSTYTVSGCTLTISANQTLITLFSISTGTLGVSDTKSLTWTSFGTGGFTAYYAFTGSNSGSDTVSWLSSGSGAAGGVYAWASTDVLYNSGSPVDHYCNASPSYTSAGSQTITECSITSSFSNDVFMYMVLTQQSQTTYNPNNGPATFADPTVTGGFIAVFANENSTWTSLVASGAAQTFTLQLNLTNNSGGSGTMYAQEVTLKPPVSPASTGFPQVIQNHSPEPLPVREAALVTGWAIFRRKDQLPNLDVQKDKK
jgi:hypothetical protein